MSKLTFKEIIQRFEQWPADNLTIQMAIGYWSGYPLLFWGLGCAADTDSARTARAELNHCHKAATYLLMRLAREN